MVRALIKKSTLEKQTPKQKELLQRLIASMLEEDEPPKCKEGEYYQEIQPDGSDPAKQGGKRNDVALSTCKNSSQVAIGF